MWYLLFLFFTMMSLGVHGVNWKQFKNTDKHYSIHRPINGMNYWEADRYCGHLGGSLASIHSNAENDFVYRLAEYGTFNGNNWEDLTLIGLQKYGSARRWGWSDNTEVDFTNWQTGEPNNYLNNEKCVVMYTATEHFYTNMPDLYHHIYRGDWNDIDCGRKYKSFVCQKEIKANADVELTSDKTKEESIPVANPAKYQVTDFAMFITATMIVHGLLAYVWKFCKYEGN